MERKSRLPMFGSSRHKTTSTSAKVQQRRQVQSAPNEPTTSDHFSLYDTRHHGAGVASSKRTANTSDGTHIVSPISHAHYDRVPYEERSIKFSPGATFQQASTQATSRLLQGTSSGCGDAPISEVSIRGIASMPSHASHAQMSMKQNSTKRGRLGLAVDAVRGVLGGNVSELKMAEKGHGMMFHSQRNPSHKGASQPKRNNQSRRDMSNTNSSQQLYIEFRPAGSPSSPPPLPSPGPCDMLSLSQPPAKRPMKMPMSTFKSNSQHSDLRSTGGESRSHLDGHLMWTKNPAASIYSDQEVPGSPPHSPLYMIYDNSPGHDTSPDHVYDSIPDDSSVDGMQEYSMSPTLPKRQPYESAGNYQSSLRPSCGIRMMKMRAEIRIASPPSDDSFPDEATVPNMSPLTSPPVSHSSSFVQTPINESKYEQLISPRTSQYSNYSLAHYSKTEKKQHSVYTNVSNKTRNSRRSSTPRSSPRSSPRNSVLKDHSPQSPLLQEAKQIPQRKKETTKAVSSGSKIVTKTQSQSKNTTSDVRQNTIPHGKRSEPNKSNRKTTLAAPKSGTERPSASGNQQRKLKQPTATKHISSKSIQLSNPKSRIESGKQSSLTSKLNKETAKPKNLSRNTHTSPLTASEKLHALKKAKSLPEEKYDSNMIQEMETVEEEKVADSMESSTSMKDSIMSMSFSSCSPQSSDSEHSGSCTSSLNSSMIMESSVESSDLERSFMKATCHMLPDLQSLDVVDINDTSTDLIHGLPLPNTKSRLKQPSRIAKEESTQSKQTRRGSLDANLRKTTSKNKSMSPSPSRQSSVPSSPAKQRIPKQSYRYGISSTASSFGKQKDNTGTDKTDASSNHVLQRHKIPPKNSNAEKSRIARSVSHQESESGVRKRSDSGIRSPSKIQQPQRSVTKNDGKRNAGCQSPRSSDNRPRISKLAMSLTTSTDRYNGQRLSLQPSKVSPKTEAKPRHHSDSTDYKRKHSNFDNVSSTSTTPSSVSGSPPSSESCTSPLSPFHSDSSSSGGGDGGCGGNSCQSSSHQTSSSQITKSNKPSSSDKSKHSNNNNKNGGSKRPINSAANTAKFMNKLVEYSDEQFGYKKCGLKPPSVKGATKLGHSKTSDSSERNCDNKNICDNNKHVSYLRKPSRTAQIERTRQHCERSRNGNLASSSSSCVRDNVNVLNNKTEKISINVHNDYTGECSDSSSPVTNLCGAGTHVPTLVSPNKIDIVSESVDYADDTGLCKDMENLTTNDRYLISEANTSEHSRSCEEDIVMDLTEDSTYKMIDNKSSDDCDDIQDEDIDLDDDDRKLMRPKDIQLISHSSDTYKRHAVYEPDTGDEQFQQIVEEAEKVINFIKAQAEEEPAVVLDVSLDSLEDKAEFVIGSAVESYEQLCEKSLEAMSSSPVKSVDYLDDSNDGLKPVESDHARDNCGSISDGGEIIRFRSASSPTLQKKIANKHLGLYGNAFADDQCSLKRVEAVNSLNVSDNDASTADDTSSNMLKDTAISESSLHTCVMKSDEVSTNMDDIADSLVKAYPNLKDCHPLSSNEEGDISEAESYVCCYNMNSSSNNLALFHDMTLSTNSLSERNQALCASESEDELNNRSSSDKTVDQSNPSENLKPSANPSKIPPRPISKLLKEVAEDDADTDTLKQSESCLTLCECRSESDSSGFTSLKDEGSVISEDGVSNSSSLSCGSTSSIPRNIHSSRLRSPRVGLNRGLKPPTPTRNFARPNDAGGHKEAPFSRRNTLAPVDEKGVATAVLKGDEGYYTMSNQGAGQVEKGDTENGAEIYLQVTGADK